MGDKLIVANLLYNNNCLGYRLFTPSLSVDGDIDVYDVAKSVGDDYDLNNLASRDILLIANGNLLVSRDEIENNYLVKDISEDKDMINKLLNIYYTDNMLGEDITDIDDDSECNVGISVDTVVSEVAEDTDNFKNSASIDGGEDEYCTEDMGYELKTDTDLVCFDDSSEDDDDIEDEDMDISIIDEYDNITKDDFVDIVDDMYNEDDEEENEEDLMVKNTIVEYLCSIYLRPSRLMKFKNFTGIPVNMSVEVGYELRKVISDLSVEDVVSDIINKMEKEGYSYKTSEEFCNGMTDGTFMSICK